MTRNKETRKSDCRKRLYKHAVAPTTFAHFSANKKNNDNGYGRSDVGDNAQTTMALRHEAGKLAIDRFDDIIHLSHVGIVIDGTGDEKMETLGPSNLHRSINVPWSYIRIKLRKLPEHPKAQQERLDRERAARIAKGQPEPHNIEVVKTRSEYEGEKFQWRQDADAKVLHVTGDTRQRLGAKLKSLGYGWNQSQMCWRTRSDGTAAIGFRTAHESQNVGINIAFAERKTAAAAA